MNEPRKAGRPRKHLEDEHHLHVASDLLENEVSDPSEPEVLEPIVYKESPIEEKIHVMVEQQRVFLSEPQTVEVSDGWNSLDTEVIIHQPPRNGMPVYLSDTPTGEGTFAFWRRTRAFNGKRYTETGKWVDFQTGMALAFTPNYWKARF